MDGGGQRGRGGCREERRSAEVCGAGGQGLSGSSVMSCCREETSEGFSLLRLLKENCYSAPLGR